jgi:hypothetical protein
MVKFEIPGQAQFVFEQAETFIRTKRFVVVLKDQERRRDVARGRS